MKYPFLLAALLLCSANLAARHPDTHTLLQPDTLSLRRSDAHTVHGSDSLGMRRPDSLRQSDALSAQQSDAPFIRPPYLRPGDTIGRRSETNIPLHPEYRSDMKYPFLLAALLLCSANLAARHPDTHTLLQPDTLSLRRSDAHTVHGSDSLGMRRPDSLRQSDALSAQQSDAPFIRPPYLRPGDTIGIVTPARKLKEKADTAKVRERFEEWGLKVKFGAHYADREQPYFAGTDARRAADLQAMIDDPGVKAVVSYQGGYGSVRLLPLLDLTPLREHPKWIVGFSDVTMLHMALGRLGVESLHATMPGKFRFGADEKPEAIVSDESLRSALFGRWTRIDAAAHPLNVSGTARGRLAGGNLSLLCSAIGTPEQPDFDTPTVLFIEEIGEQMYRLDRMMQQLERSGILAKCKAVLVGHFTDMLGQKHFGVWDPCDIIAAYVRPLGIPVVFGIPAGHEDPNVALYMGREVAVTVNDAGASVEF